MRDKKEILDNIAVIRNMIKEGFKERYIDMKESEKWNSAEELKDRWVILLDELKEIDPQKAEIEEESFDECHVGLGMAEDEIIADMDGDIKATIMNNIKSVKELMSSRNKLNSSDDSIVYKWINKEIMIITSSLKSQLQIVEYVDPELAKKIKEQACDILQQAPKKTTGQGDSEQGTGKNRGDESDRGM